MRTMKLLLFLIASSFVMGQIKTQEKATMNEDAITIRTDQSDYKTNSDIAFEFTKKIKKEAFFFVCDNNQSLHPSKVLKYDSGKWIESVAFRICTAMWPSGYFGKIDRKSTQFRAWYKFTEKGKFKLRYRFIIDRDTLDFDSNEVTIY